MAKEEYQLTAVLRHFKVAHQCGRYITDLEVLSIMAFSRPFLASIMLMLSSVVKGNAEVCSLPEAGSELELQHLFRHLILHEDYPRCHSVDFANEMLVCEIWDATDKDALRPTCGAGLQSRHHFNTCPDGSGNQTCVPIDGGLAYTCACHSLRKYTTCVTSYRWDGEWREIEGTQQGLYRQFCDPNTLSCPITERRFGVAHLAKYTKLPDDRFDASSLHNNNHVPARVRIDNYLEQPCCLTTDAADPDKWVQFDLITAHVGLGALITERCDYEAGVQRLTNVDIACSSDTSIWEFAASDVTPVYAGTLSYTYEAYTHWFHQPHYARYWRIYTHAWIGRPSLKADIIGKI